LLGYVEGFTVIQPRKILWQIEYSNIHVIPHLTSLDKQELQQWASEHVSGVRAATQVASLNVMTAYSQQMSPVLW